jgi:mono/diheme cytochrome c family protein
MREFVVKAQFALPLVLLAACGLAGCGQPPEASFAPNSQKLEPLIPEARAEVAAALNEYFGTPNQLVGWEKFPIDYGKGDTNLPKDDSKATDGWRLMLGRNLYMTHCLHCHGVAGDGNGPTAKFLNPRPRDYRQGKFKFKSTLGATGRPSRNDLVHILEQGIPGTYMPSFVLLGDEKLRLIVDYVRWLSIRGDMEIRLAEEFVALNATAAGVAQEVANGAEQKLQKSDVIKATMESVEKELPGLVGEVYTTLEEFWTTADLPESVVVPPVPRTLPTKKSLARGKDLFLSKVEGKKTKCVDCHGATGRGDGTSTEEFWPITDAKPPRKYEVPGLHDDWGHPQKPRDLTRGIYRGGRRPIDIYRRIYTGITGTQMPGFGGTILTAEEIWDVVNYVLSIPFDGEQSAYPADVKEDKAEDKHKVATTED